LYRRLPKSAASSAETAVLKIRDTAGLEICATPLYCFGEADGAAVPAGSTPAPESGAAEEGDEL
jgi:hypothetical protein